MTQEELDALPEDGVFYMRHETHPETGRTMAIPVMRTVGVLWSEDGEPCMVTDIQGQRWMIGWYNGVRYKRRMSSLR